MLSADAQTLLAWIKQAHPDALNAHVAGFLLHERNSTERHKAFRLACEELVAQGLLVKGRPVQRGSAVRNYWTHEDCFR